MVQFAVAGLVVTLALAALTGVLARLAGADQAEQSFESLARVAAAALTPSLDAAPSPDPERPSVLQRQVQDLRAAGPVVRVKVWDASGRIVWSDERRLVGRVFPLSTGARRALQTGGADSRMADPSSPADADERGLGRLLEAFVGVRDSRGTRLLVDVYEPWNVAAGLARQSWLQFTPAALGALILLELVQIPLAGRLARRLGRAEDAEAALMRATVEVSEAERSRIAAEIHDHVVQDLTALAIDLDTMRLLRSTRGPDDESWIAETARRLRGSITDLRTLLTSFLPARLPHDDLSAALRDLGTGLERTGTQLQVEMSGAERLDRQAAVLLYRCAQEALRNVAAHSRAAAVELSVRVEGGRVVMIVDDDGCGFDGRRLEERTTHGHVGLRALGELLADSGGSLTASSAPGQGTRLVASIPLRPVGEQAGVLR
ncbi:MAG: histidine kinase [Frankiales bacterium]|nr:histidine kinase [Frankiales bacterium]